MLLVTVIFPDALLSVMPAPATREFRIPLALLTKLAPVPAEVSAVMPWVILLETVTFPEALLSVMPAPATREFRMPLELFTRLVPVPADVKVTMP